MQLTRASRAAWLLASCVAAACGGSKGPSAPSSPTAVTTPRPALVMSVATTPLTSSAVIGASGKPVHTLTVQVTFRETGGAAAHVTALTLSLLDDTGLLAPAAERAVDVAVAASSTAQHDLRQAFEVERSPEAARVRITGRARDASGASLEVSLVEAAVRLATPPPPPVATVLFSGAGDIGLCGSPGPEATAKLLDATPGVIFTLGDNAYPHASPENFRNCYDPSWGRHRARTRPIPGNHDWYNNLWGAYFEYFGANAGPPGLGYYSYDLGGWHVLALNSNLHGNAGSPQHEWVRADLAASRSACIVALWHHPRYTSGPSGNDTTMKDIWKLLQDAGAELVLSGHDHIYERFAPQDADGRRDLARGIRQFVVGTGGYTLYDLRSPAANSEVRDNRSWGIIRLTLHPASYEWEFVPVAGATFRDGGTAECSR
jgi:hypothetical protein